MSHIGRPTHYTEEIATEFCQRIALGNSLRKVCEADDMPAPKVIFDWMRKHESFGKQYARACEERAEANHEELLDLGDTAINLSKQLSGPQASAAVQAVKLKADNIKWSMSKMIPKKYGDKLDMTTNGKDLPTPILGGATVKKNDE